MFALLLLAFVPREQTLHADRPVVHLDLSPALQWRMAARADWRAFRARWGGHWWVRWDPRNATPRFVGVPGVPAAEGARLVAELARLAGVDPAELSLAREVERGDRRIRRWTRTWRGAVVEDDQVALVETGGRIGAAWVQLTPIRLAGQPRPGERVRPLPDGRPVLVTREDRPDEVIYRDRAGRVVQRWDPRLHATISVSCEERTVGDEAITAPARRVTVTDAVEATEVTGDDGVCSLSGAVSVLLDGPSLRVTENRASIEVSGTDDFTMIGGTDLSRPASTVLHHTHVVRDWLEALWPEHAWLPEVVQADVNQSGGTCNAYYTGGTINFYPGGSCNNLGQIADVVYHEYGHGVHDYIMAAGTFASDISEGSADYVSATINDDPNVAPEWYPGEAYLRELDTDHVYPDDIVGEPHYDGLVWGSFLWDLREDWIAAYGDEDGVDMADLILLGALEQGPELTDAYEAVLVADDDDGDWSNGTPHDCELIELLDEHGLGPGALGVYQVEHTPLGPQASDATSYPVELSMTALSADCGDVGPPTVSLWYSDDDSVLPPLGAGDYTGWQELALESSEDGTWTGELPRQPANTHIRYFFEFTAADGSESALSHDGMPELVNGFWVGDRAELWCDDFEGDTSAWTSGAGLPWMIGGESPTWTSEWTFAAPAGDTWRPDAAYSGSLVASTGTTGEYAHNNVQYLASPTVDLSGEGLMRLLSYRRWLSVEDAFYDQATVSATGADGQLLSALWTNPRTIAGTYTFLDTDWTLHDLGLDRLLPADGQVRLVWTLQTDPGLAFGGWSLDDVCVVELDDLAGHYRVDDLVATVGERSVVLTWTTPWIRPLGYGALVKKAGSWPEGPEDGILLEEDIGPAWGEEHRVEDAELSPGETWYYAVFAGDDERLWTEVVEGENGVAAGLPAPEEEPPEPEDSDTGTAAADTDPREDEGDPEEPPPKDDTACGGCAATPASGLVPALLALAGSLRRRRR